MKTKQLIFALAATSLFIQTAKPPELHAETTPNVVIIFIDDMGYGDIGPFGSTRETPHLDRMAREGMKLTDFYVSSSACTPSRSALMTGCYADRIGMGTSVVFPADKRGLSPSEITIAEILKEGGYATGCFGKWHLGDQPEFMPTRQGFDEYQGIPYSNDMWVKGNPKRNYPPLPWMKQDKPVAHIPDEASQAAITDAIADAAVDFIKRHKDEPFFAYVPHSAVHYPFAVTPDRLAAAGEDVMAALISEVDNSTGRILQTLRDLGIDDNTFVLFTNDNGGAGKTSPGPLRGAKFGPKYEGHMRVATLAWWPGKIPAGSVSSEIMTTTDVLPTVAKLTGQPIPTDRIIDGKDVSDILLGKDGAKSPHETLYYENDGIRQGKWKLVHYRIKADWFTELYDLEADLGERTNIADQHPDRVKAMKAALDAHVAEIKQNSRSAGSVENPKPLLADASGLPTLAEYVSGTRRSTGIIDLTLTFAPKGDMTLNVRGLTIHCDEAKQEFQFTNTTRVEGEKAAMLRLPKERQRPYRDNGLRTIPAPMVDGKVTLRVLVDRASLELFVNDGQAAASFVVVPKADDRRISIDGNDEMKINSLIVNELKSVWPEDLLSEPLAVRTERNFPCDSKTKPKRQS